MAVLPDVVRGNAKIHFSVLQLQRLSLGLYDISGRKVETAVDAIFGPGTYTYYLNFYHYNSGIYFFSPRRRKGDDKPEDNDCKVKNHQIHFFVKVENKIGVDRFIL
ncbi:MAG: hypothetical protein ABIL69_11485 [candidate division WOR-3 bacterium]